MRRAEAALGLVCELGMLAMLRAAAPAWVRAAPRASAGGRRGIFGCAAPSVGCLRALLSPLLSPGPLDPQHPPGTRPPAALPPAVGSGRPGGRGCGPRQPVALESPVGAGDPGPRQGSLLKRLPCVRACALQEWPWARGRASQARAGAGSWQDWGATVCAAARGRRPYGAYPWARASKVRRHLQRLPVNGANAAARHATSIVNAAQQRVVVPVAAHAAAVDAALAVAAVPVRSQRGGA
jgi:hypothetical protein